MAWVVAKAEDEADEGLLAVADVTHNHARKQIVSRKSCNERLDSRAHRPTTINSFCLITASCD